jgi:putative DNA-invertase from lambdoid prophage Rac
LAVLKPGDVVIASKLDRIFRSAVDALENLDALKRGGVSLHSIDLGGDVTGNGIAKLVFTILSAVAEAERDRIRQRITDVKTDQRQRGRYLGGKRPFGYRAADGELVEDESEQAAIKLMHKHYKKGLSLRAIAASVRATGIKISHEGVAKVLARKPGWPSTHLVDR